MPPEDVPSVQKQVIHAGRLAGKPVLVATQMLESMISAPTPTRAEASDVATAVYEGADAVMLSAETAVGQYPIEAVAMMDRIARRVQAHPPYFQTLDPGRLPPARTNPDALNPRARFSPPPTPAVWPPPSPACRGGSFPLRRAPLPRKRGRVGVGLTLPDYPACSVVGSIILRTSVILLAGNPLICACCLMMSSS